MKEPKKRMLCFLSDLKLKSDEVYKFLFDLEPTNETSIEYSKYKILRKELTKLNLKIIEVTEWAKDFLKVGEENYNNS